MPANLTPFGQQPKIEIPWKLLHLFNLYRLTLAFAFVALFFADFGPAYLGKSAPGLYAVTSISYLGAILANGLLLYWHTIRGERQALLMVLVDILAIILIIHASGGIQTGLGALLAVSITFGSLIHAGPHSYLFASVSTLAVIGQQFFAHLSKGDSLATNAQAAFLSISFFAIALLSHVLAARTQRIEKIASQRSLDLANMAELNSYVIQHMETGIIVIDESGEIKLINGAAWQLLGMPDAKQGNPLEAASPQLAKLAHSSHREQRDHPIPFTPIASDRELSAKINNLGSRGEGGCVILVEDTSIINQQAQQLKLASLGRLTASIAHEIRNPLGAISHAEQLLRESPDLTTADDRLISIITTNVDRVNEVIENVLQLSKRSRTHPVNLPLATWLNKMAEDFRQSNAIETQQLVVQILPATTEARVDSSQLRQILTILLENAINHFNEKKSELRLQIICGITRESSGPILDVVDNGPGIPAHIVKQIFEPFFTTQNAGTGLGLYIAKELSEANRMDLDYITLPAGGSCFRISFPVTTEGAL